MPGQAEQGRGEERRLEERRGERRGEERRGEERRGEERRGEERRGEERRGEERRGEERRGEGTHAAQVPFHGAIAIEDRRDGGGSNGPPLGRARLERVPRLLRLDLPKAGLSRSRFLTASEADERPPRPPGPSVRRFQAIVPGQDQGAAETEPPYASPLARCAPCSEVDLASAPVVSSCRVDLASASVTSICRVDLASASAAFLCRGDLASVPFPTTPAG